MIEYLIGFFAFLTLYNEINFFLIKKKIKGPAKILKGAESFFNKKGKTGVLLIHGFSSSPSELNDLSKTLTSKNITTYCPLLQGHGTSPERLVLIKYFQWVEKINESIKFLEKECNEIYLIGNSLGGNLALISAEKSKKIKGIITLGTPIYFHNHRINKNIILPILRRIKLFQKKKYKNPRLIKKLNKSRVSYTSIPLKSLLQVIKIIELSKKNLKKIKKPLLIMQTKNDGVVKEESGRFIIQNTSSKKKFLKTIPESYHVFILDKHKEKAKKEILKFIKQTTSNKKLKIRKVIKK